METVVRVFTDLLAAELPHRLPPPDVEISPDLTQALPPVGAPDLYRFGSDDFLVITLFTVLLLVARQFAATYVLMPTARSFGIHKVFKLQKFAEAGWFFVYYVPIFSWGLSIVIRHEMSFPVERIFANSPQDTMSYEVKMYILGQYAFYFHALVVIGILETRRKDYLEMCIHHIATIGLMTLARGHAFLHIAITVLVIHDFSDIFLYLAKVFNYCKFEAVTNVTFAIFALSFAVARLGYFPCVIYTWITQCRVAAPHAPLYVYYATIIGFVTLVFLHVFWFRSILKMVFEALGAGKLDRDPRSDDDKDN